MPVWDASVRELAGEAVRSGHSGRPHRRFHTAGPGSAALRWPGNRHADPAELLEGRGSRLFLVVTDGLAPGWAERGADELLGRLSSSGSTALVHLLPRICATGPRSTRSGPGWTRLDSARSTGISSATLRTGFPTRRTSCPRRVTGP
ncbi:hypothetical protein NKH18_44120 [Streptomyces sp. M10(2022)]